MSADLKSLSDLLDKKLKTVLEKIDDLEIEIDDKISNISSSILHLKVDFKEETSQIKRRLKEIKNDQNTIIKFFDGEYLALKKRITHIEGSLKLPQES